MKRGPERKTIFVQKTRNKRSVRDFRREAGLSIIGPFSPSVEGEEGGAPEYRDPHAVSP